LSLRKKVNIRVRQPLQKILIPLLNKKFEQQIKAVENLILTEVNVKELEFIADTTGILVKRIKPNFKTLGPRYGKLMKKISQSISDFKQEEIKKIEENPPYDMVVNGQKVVLNAGDVEIFSEDIPGWLVTNEGNVTVALDIKITDELKQEGIARELINRIQNLRKERGFEVTDKIEIFIQKQNEITNAIMNNIDYICSETLAKHLHYEEILEHASMVRVELTENIQTYVSIEKIKNKNK